jgi:uncharacterized glyoxalase superfamily protein PhnB
MVNPIPEGTHTVTPHLIVRGGDRAIEFYKQAFGAVETTRMPAPDGSIMHAELRIGDSPVYLAEENPAWGALSPLALGGSPVSIHLYVPDVDASFERAIQAGATVRMPLSNAFWGDRYGQLGDPFGHVWSIATHTEDVSPEELERRARETFASMPAQEAGAASRPEPEPTGGEVRRRSAPQPAEPRPKPAARKPARRPAKKAAKKKTARKKTAKKKVAKKRAVKKATRKKTARKVARRKPARKKPARKKAKKTARRKPARRKARKTARKKTARKKAKKTARRKTARKATRKTGRTKKAARKRGRK